MNIFNTYINHCIEKGMLTPRRITTVNAPYQATTLFQIAGIQTYKAYLESDVFMEYVVANSQNCLRFNDFDNLDQQFHRLTFYMLGLFSFRCQRFTLQSVVEFWLDFCKKLNFLPDYATIHPNKPEWSEIYDHHNIPIRYSSDCEWTDGSIKGYCTEFFKEGLEIGNIVNPAEGCFDCGFGEERLDYIVNRTPQPSKLEKLINAAQAMIACWVRPGPKEQGYALRKTLRAIYRLGGSIDNQFFVDEVKRQQDMLGNYKKLKAKNMGKPAAWWLDTHGIVLEEVENE